MSLHPAASRLRARQEPPRSLGSRVRRFLRLTFISGPKTLLTSRISAKCAIMMMLMCSPALLLCGLMTLPELIFQSPQQQAYFHFARVLNEDPTRWIALCLAAICVVTSLAMPATMRNSSPPIRY